MLKQVSLFFFKSKSDKLLTKENGFGSSTLLQDLVGLQRDSLVNLLCVQAVVYFSNYIKIDRETNNGLIYFIKWKMA